MIGIQNILRGKKNIFDIGTGPKGAYWWSLVEKKTKINGIDTLFFPQTKHKNVKVYKLNASKLYLVKNRGKVNKLIKYNPPQFVPKSVRWENKFDLVVANHVLEHVENVEATIKGIYKIIKAKGTVYITFPASNNFTDIFYHLIHPEGGGHIQKLSKTKVLNCFKKNGFDLVSCEPIPDDWLWFEKHYDYQNRGIKYINNKEISKLANIFRKELTLKKGYFYGWEMVFSVNK